MRNEIFALCVKYCYLSRSSINSIHCILGFPGVSRIILESFKVWDCETVFCPLFSLDVTFDRVFSGFVDVTL